MKPGFSAFKQKSEKGTRAFLARWAVVDTRQKLQAFANYFVRLNRSLLNSYYEFRRSNEYCPCAQSRHTNNQEYWQPNRKFGLTIK